MNNTIGELNSKPHILIVDDEENIRLMLKRHFKFLGYEVEDRENGTEALKLLYEKRFEVIISDINMPKMNGMEFLKKVKQEYPMTHCIMITGYVTMQNVLTCMRYGADTCIFKPLEDMTELEEAVKNAVDQLKKWQVKLKAMIHMKPEK